MKRICIFCKYYYFIPGNPDETMGNDVEEGCRRGHWETDIFEDDEDIRRTKLTTSESCKDYKFFKEKGE